MPSENRLQRAREILLADVHYGPRFQGIDCKTDQEAMDDLRAGDILIHYAPQLRQDRGHYEERLIKGCMHIALIAAFGEQALYKIEMIQFGPICLRHAFDDITQRDSDLRRYHIVLRSRSISADPARQRQLNERILTYAGFEDRGGLPLRSREVKGSMFLETHRSTTGPLPSSLYCSELAYLAYRDIGMEICPLVSLSDLMADIPPPDRSSIREMAETYALGSRAAAFAYRTLGNIERLMRKLGVGCLQPSRYIYRHAVWPHFIFENPEFEIMTVVPPEEHYIKQYEAELAG